MAGWLAMWQAGRACVQASVSVPCACACISSVYVWVCVHACSRGVGRAACVLDLCVGGGGSLCVNQLFLCPFLHAVGVIPAFHLA